MGISLNLLNPSQVLFSTGAVNLIVGNGSELGVEFNLTGLFLSVVSTDFVLPNGLISRDTLGSLSVLNMDDWASFKEGLGSVSYTHLTLPTILLV